MRKSFCKLFDCSEASQMATAAQGVTSCFNIIKTFTAVMHV